MANEDNGDLEGLVGRRVRRLRERQGLTQTELGRLAGLGSGRQSLIAKLEAGQRPLRLNEVAALAVALKVPLLDLVETTPSQAVAEATAALERVQLILEDVIMRQGALEDEARELAQLRDRYAAEVATAEERVRAAREVEVSGQPGETV